MKKLFSFIPSQELSVTIILMWALVLLSSVTEVQAEGDVSTLIAALSKNGISVPDHIDYDELVMKLQSLQIDVSLSYKDRVMKYLDAGKAPDLIKIRTSKPGILAWYFHSVIFLKRDLVFAQYDDGEMFGGDILLRVKISGNEVTGMRCLWNYH